MIELSESARAFISPSDLTFSWDGCHRCLWLSYKHQLRAPNFMPLVGDLAEMQEQSCVNKPSSDLHPDMPEGKAISKGGWVVSKPIEVDGEPTPFAIRGKYDLLMEFPDGTYGIVDCKFQAKDSDKTNFYSAQLEAYAFALEHPAKDSPKTISHIGLLVWSPVKIRGNSSGNFGMELKCSWYPIQRNPDALAKRLAEFIKEVTGDIPPAKSNCEQCNYVANREGVIKGL
mgnify:FL=1